MSAKTPIQAISLLAEDSVFGGRRSIEMLKMLYVQHIVINSLRGITHGHVLLSSFMPLHHDSVFLNLMLYCL